MAQSGADSGVQARFEFVRLYGWASGVLHDEVLYVLVTLTPPSPFVFG